MGLNLNRFVIGDAGDLSKRNMRFKKDKKDYFVKNVDIVLLVK